MRVTNRVLSLLAVGMLTAGSAAHAQVTYFTEGMFTSNQGAACNTGEATTVQCGPLGGVQLVFKGVTGTNLGSPTFGQTVGNFFLTGATGPGGVLADPGNIQFTLFIHQTSPTTGQASTVGTITGTVTLSATNQSNLVWTPATRILSIAPVTYALVLDNSGPGAGHGISIGIDQGSGSQVKADITSTPEPGSIALFATGLAGLLPVVARRRKNAK